MQPAPRTAVHSSIGHARAMSTPPPTDAMATSGVSALASLCAEFIQSAAGPSGEEEAVDKQRATAALTQIMLSQDTGQGEQTSAWRAGATVR